MTKDLILAIDNGTQSVRGTDLRSAREPAGEGARAAGAVCRTAAGLGRKRPRVLLGRCSARPARQLWEQTEAAGQLPDLRERIAGVALTTQRSTLINVAEDGRPLRPAIVWLDQRRTEGLKRVSGLWGLAFALTGMTETAAYLQAEAEANWIQTHQPEIWARTHKYLLLSGYLTYRLTGRFVDSAGCQVAYMPFDYKKLRWASKFDWKWQAVPMKPSLLPDLVPPAGLLGEITAAAAADTGIPAGLPLIAAAADKACEVIGAGCLEPHVGCLSYGTTATINTTHHRYVEAIPLIPPYPAAVPGAYSLEIQVYRGFWMVSWFKEQFGYLEQQLAGEARGRARGAAG